MGVSRSSSITCQSQYIRIIVNFIVELEVIGSYGTDCIVRMAAPRAYVRTRLKTFYFGFMLHLDFSIIDFIKKNTLYQFDSLR